MGGDKSIRRKNTGAIFIQEERHILFIKKQIEWNNDDQDKMLL